MTRNRSVPDASVIPVRAYADVPYATEWLCCAFGFRERTFSESLADLDPAEWGGTLIAE